MKNLHLKVIKKKITEKLLPVSAFHESKNAVAEDPQFI